MRHLHRWPLRGRSSRFFKVTWLRRKKRTYFLRDVIGSRHGGKVAGSCQDHQFAARQLAVEILQIPDINQRVQLAVNDQCRHTQSFQFGRPIKRLTWLGQERSFCGFGCCPGQQIYRPLTNVEHVRFGRAVRRKPAQPLKVGVARPLRRGNACLEFGVWCFDAPCSVQKHETLKAFWFSQSRTQRRRTASRKSRECACGDIQGIHD